MHGLWGILLPALAAVGGVLMAAPWRVTDGSRPIRWAWAIAYFGLWLAGAALWQRGLEGGAGLLWSSVGLSGIYVDRWLDRRYPDSRGPDHPSAGPTPQELELALRLAR